MMPSVSTGWLVVQHWWVPGSCCRVCTQLRTGAADPAGHRTVGDGGLNQREEFRLTCLMW